MHPLNDALEDEFFSPAPSTSGGAVWMLSFADLLSVLLCFFVMLYSTTAIQNEKWEQFLLSLKNESHFLQKAPTIEAYLPDSEALPTENLGSDLDYLRTVLSDKSSSFPEIAKAKIIRSKNMLILSYTLDTFYTDDEFQSKQALPLLSSLANIFDLISNHIDVAVVIPRSGKSGRIDIWQQSLLKARRIANEISDSGYHSPINAYSYISAHVNDSWNDTEKPRVDIIIRDTANKPKN